MATTAVPNRPRRRSQQPRASVRDQGVDGGHEHEYDLLTAALLGVTIGAGVLYLLRRGPSGRRPVMPLMENVGRGAGWAGRHAARLGNSGARWAAHRGGDMWDRVPRDEIREHLDDYREHLGEYLGRAREAIDDAVSSELDDLRKAVRRQRKRLGV